MINTIKTSEMTKLPELKTYNFASQEQVFPNGEKSILLISFDKLHYPTVLEWYRELSKESNLPVYNIPLLSDRFTLMQDVLFEGIRVFFREIEDSTKPAFVNRIKFFDTTGLDEEKPIIVVVDKDGECSFCNELSEIKSFA